MLLLLSSSPPCDSSVWCSVGKCVLCLPGCWTTDHPAATGYSIVSTRLSSHAGLLDRNTQTTIICLCWIHVFFFVFCWELLKGSIHGLNCVTVALGPAGKLTSRSLPPQRGYWGLSTRWARCLFLCSSLTFQMGFQRLNLFCLKLGLATGIKRHVEMIDWKFVGNVLFVKLYYLILHETTSECFFNETESWGSQVVNKSNLLSWFWFA